MPGKVKRLNEAQRLEIISKLSQPNCSSKRSIARQYEVSEIAIKKVWLNREAIRNRSVLMPEEAKNVGRYTELADKLFCWIDSMCRANLPIPFSLVILKAKQIAEQLLISQENFTAL